MEINMFLTCFKENFHVILMYIGYDNNDPNDDYDFVKKIMNLLKIGNKNIKIDKFSKR
jgi:hypothetical protein